jgi:hypothetical protein
MPSNTGCIRVGPMPLDARELDRHCRDVWDNIAGETGLRTAHAKKVTRLYMLCRDIQQAALDGARFETVRKVIDLICHVAVRSFGMRLERV